MSSVNAILRKKKNKQGQFPIAIRITKNRKSSYLYTGHYIELNQWDDAQKRVRRNHPNSTRLNNLILKKLTEATDSIIDNENNQQSVSISSLKDKLKSNGELSNFFGVANIHLENLAKRGQHHQINTEKGRLNTLRDFAKTQNLPFSSINERFLNNFRSYLKSSKKISERTIVNYLILIRTIFNVAIKEQLIDKNTYPFGRGKISIRIPETEKVGLSKQDVITLENIKLESEAQQHALNVWLFSFYLAGIRVGDLLKLRIGDFQEGRINYRMNKNKKLVSLKLPERAMEILTHYKEMADGNDDFLFPELREAKWNDPKDITRKTQTATRKFNKHLKAIAKKANIEKKISMHIARHTFGSISGSKIPIQMLQKLYRHSSVITTINYQANFIHKEEDEALDKVLDF